MAVWPALEMQSINELPTSSVLVLVVVPTSETVEVRRCETEEVSCSVASLPTHSSDAHNRGQLEVEKLLRA